MNKEQFQIIPKPEEKSSSSEEQEERNKLQEELEESLSGGWIVAAEKIIDSAKERGIILNITSAYQKGLEKILSKGWIGAAEELINSAEKRNIIFDIISACQKGLEENLLDKRLKIAFEIQERFLHLSPEKAFELYSPLLKEVKLPSACDLIERSKKSIDLLFSLFAFRENPK